MLYCIVRRNCRQFCRQTSRAKAITNTNKNILSKLQRRVFTIKNRPKKSKYTLQLNVLYNNQYIRRLNAFSHRHPLILATGIATVRCTICDVYFGQHWVEGRKFKDINWERGSLFAIFGFFYVGLVQYSLYSKLYPVLFNRIKVPIWKAISQTLVDMTCHATVIYFPTFYIFKAYVYERKLNPEIIKKALHKYWYINFYDDMKHLYAVWTGSIFLCFFVIPIRLRVPWIDFCGIGWITLLSVTRGEKNRDVDLSGNKLE